MSTLNKDENVNVKYAAYIKGFPVAYDRGHHWYVDSIFDAALFLTRDEAMRLLTHVCESLRLPYNTLITCMSVVKVTVSTEQSLPDVVIPRKCDNQ